MEDLPIDKIQITGAALASLLHRTSASSGDTHGYIFGHKTLTTPTTLTDHPTSTPPPTLLISTITSFLSLPTHLPLPPTPPPTTPPTLLLGFFSSRRKTPLRPSLKDSTFPLSQSQPIFLLITTPFHDQLIHTLEYKAFLYEKDRNFTPKSLEIVNIGPSFRSKYESFVPSVPFPVMGVELRGSGCNSSGDDGMVVERGGESLSSRSKGLKDQKVLDGCCEGFEIGRLGKLIKNGGGCCREVEVLYEGMLGKIGSLARLVEVTNDQVRKQEERNMKLRYKVAGLE